MGFINQTNDSETPPLHSNAYGEVAGADGSVVGDVGISMEQRKLLESKRRYVANYKQSALGTAYVPLEMRHYHSGLRSTIKVAERSTNRVNGRQEMNATKGKGQLAIPERQSGNQATNFQEPSARSYNPYS